VDHILKETGHPTVSKLDAAIQGRAASEATGDLKLVPNEPEGRSIYRTARVGLTLKKATRADGPEVDYLLRRYRFLTEPRGIAKGKPLLVLDRLAAGESVAVIHTLTGSLRASIEKLRDARYTGQGRSVSEFVGGELSGPLLAQLHGLLVPTVPD
jgi:hypothetical protein